MAAILRVRAFWEGVPGGPAYGNWYFDGLPVDSQGVSDAIGAFLGAVDAFQSSTTEWRTDEVVATIDSLTGDITGLTNVTPSTGTGALATEMLPRATQALIHWRTGVFQGGREIRGRTNLPYFTEATNTAGGIMLGTTQTAVQAAADTLVGGVGFAQMVVWSRVSGAIPLVDSALVNEEWAVLRSRRD